MDAAILNRLVKIRLTLFGLPITLAAALLPFASGAAIESSTVIRWLLITVAFSSARTAGMAFNELIDRKMDAANPRTQHRVLPSREVRPREVAILAWTFLALFLVACWRINALTCALSTLVALLIWAYAYTKRFTALCHFILGLIHFFNPVMAWVAITGHLSLAPACLGAAAFCSISAQDILYALQDRLFDSQHGVYSVPAWLGQRTSVHLAKGLHGLAIILLFATGVIAKLHWAYFAGIAMLAVLLFVLYRLAGDVATLSRALISSNTLFAAMTFGSVLIGWVVGRL